MPGETKILQFSEGVETTAPVVVKYTYYESDAVTWNGSTKTKAYNVSGQGVTEAHKMIWQLKLSVAPYTIQGGDVTHTSGTNVTFTFEENLASATYIVVGR